MISPRFLLTGDPTLATRYVGMAKKLAVSAFQAGIISKIWNVADGISIRVMNNVQANICKVYINAARETIPAYQFYGSEGTLYKTFEDPNIPGRWLPLGNWVLVNAKLRKGSLTFESKPLLSSLRESSDDPAKWVYNPNPFLSMQPGVEDVLYLSPMHQPDGAGVKKWQSIERNDLWLVSTFAEPKPDYALAWYSGGTSYYLDTGVSDQGFDYCPVVYSGNKGTYQAPDSDWWRGACLYTATSDNFGSRTFIIMVAIDHTFYCYPVGAYDPAVELPNVDNGFVQFQEAPLPDWVTLFDIGKDSVKTSEEQAKFLQPLWVFSPQGDKAAAVFYHRDEVWSDAHITSSRYLDGVSGFDLQESRPGVVEVAFTVTITGEDSEDFTFIVEGNQTLYSGDDGRGYIAVNYASQDFLELPGNAKYNDLLILEHRYYRGEILFPATLFESGLYVNGDLFDEGVHVLLEPPLVAVAQVTVSSEITPIMSWLSSYLVRSGTYSGIIPDGDATLPDSAYYAPTFDEISDWPSAEDRRRREFCFHTAINAMDLANLAFCFGSTLTMVGFSSSFGSAAKLVDGQIVIISYNSPICASAAYVSTYSLGVLDEEKWVGHNDLKLAVKSYFNLTNTRPDFDLFTEFNLNGVISQTGVVVPDTGYTGKGNDLRETNYQITVDEAPGVPSGEYGFDLQVQFAEFTITSGIEDGTRTEDIMWAMDTVWRKINQGTGYLSQYGPVDCRGYWIDQDAFHTWKPRVFSYFDGDYYNRPGMRWTEIELYDADPQYPRWVGVNEVPTEYMLSAGDSSFTNYPYGLIVHTRLTDVVTHPLNNLYANINAEPNGSYAVFFGPFAAPTTTIKTYYNLNAAVPNFSPELTLEQNFMDVIRIRYPKKGVYIEGKTTHLSQMNSAYDLNLTYNDYIFNFAFFGGSGRLKVKHKILVPNDLGYISVGNIQDYNPQIFEDELLGGAIYLGPLAVGWKKTLHAQGVTGGINATLPVFDLNDIAALPTTFSITRPTPRIEGLFTQLPMKET